MPLKKTVYRGHENKDKCENTIYFPQMMVYTNFERTFKIKISTGLFYSWKALKRFKPVFQIF